MIIKAGVNLDTVFIRLESFTKTGQSIWVTPKNHQHYIRHHQGPNPCCNTLSRDIRVGCTPGHLFQYIYTVDSIIQNFGNAK